MSTIKPFYIFTHKVNYNMIIILKVRTQSHLYTGWPIKNRTAYFPQYVDA